MLCNDPGMFERSSNARRRRRKRSKRAECCTRDFTVRICKTKARGKGGKKEKKRNAKVH